uniref:Uncharacterized protein n=1 Tax=Arundo donax TaxID=35708 RepID=A0A0A8YZ33_ARUDO
MVPSIEELHSHGGMTLRN